jgi:hypothetical protein
VIAGSLVLAATAFGNYTASDKVAGRRVAWPLQRGNTAGRWWVMGIQDWCDLPQIHPSKIRVGDIIGTMKPSKSRLTVKMISGPQTSPRRWTFFGRDDIGRQHTSTFGEDEFVRKYS